MNEHTFTRAINGKLPKVIHVQSMTFGSVSMNGTPDRYYDYKDDLWVEFKFARALGKQLKVHEMLTDLQRRWLRRRWDAGKNACVIVGYRPEKTAYGLILESPKEWEAPIPRDDVLNRLVPVPSVAHYIEARVNGYSSYDRLLAAQRL